jgi:hypothetical protein
MSKTALTGKWFCVLLVSGVAGCGKDPTAKIERLGGRVATVEFGLEGIVRHVDLSNTRVTDAGLKHLKEMTDLQTLHLGRTKVTDAGLEHLKGMTRLKHLDLRNTQVTEAGANGLKQALPNVRISRWTR